MRALPSPFKLHAVNDPKIRRPGQRLIVARWEMVTGGIRSLSLLTDGHFPLVGYLATEATALPLAPPV
jgi:hypothetical protein